MQTGNAAMYEFRIAYQNRQGTLMRILAIVARRGLDLRSVHADQAGDLHEVILRVGVNPKQLGQLCREWSVAPDVVEIREPRKIAEAWKAFPRMRKAFSGRGWRSAHPARAALARLLAIVPSR